MVFSGPLLNLALHVPAGCITFPGATEQALLREAGVSTIIADSAGTATTCIPVVALSEVADELLLNDGSRRPWLRGDRASLLERAAAASPGFAASLPRGSAASKSQLRRSCLLAWQLHATHGCRTLVLLWPELEAAAEDSGDWDSIAAQLTRMRQPTWSVIQGG